MNRFALTADFPMQMEGHAINPHFANVLKILDILGNENDETKKILAVLENFFLEPIDIRLAIELFCKFLAEEKPETEIPAQQPIKAEPQSKRFCFNFDAKEIYADFLREYSICLLSVEYLHWHKFSILLQGLSDESALKQKIALRFMDLSQYKDKVRSEMERTKKSVQLPIRLSSAEMDYWQEMRGRLRQGKKVE